MTHPPLPEQAVYLAFNFGGLGDDICRLPALKFLLRENPHARVTLACADYLVPIINHFFKPGELEEVISFKKMTPELMKRTWIQTKTEFFTPMRTHLVLHAFSYICDRVDIPIEDQNYLQFRTEEIDVSKFTLPPSFVVLTPGFTAPVRSLPAKTWNEIADYLNSRGVTPVYLGAREVVRGGPAEKIEGKFDEQIDYTKGLDLRDQTSLLEAARIMSESLAVVGLDNGLLHVAGGTDVPIIAAYTNASPDHRLPIRENHLGWNCYPITPPGCHACQSTVSTTLMQHDFRECVWPELKCGEKLTSDLFIKELECVLKH